MTDTGTGMSLDVQKRAFEPFFTTKDSATGLGLAIVYAFVTRNRGEVKLRSEPGGGTRVTLALPRN